jgi:hypothetical protein
MRFARPVAAALTLSLAASTAATAQDVDPRFTAFADACFGPGLQPPISAVLDTALGLGWTRVDRTADPELQAVVGNARAAASEDASGIPVTFVVIHQLTRDLGGTPLYLMITEAGSEAGSSASCYLFDFAADAALEVEPISAMVGIAPGQTRDEPGTFAVVVWYPVLVAPSEIVMLFVPPGSSFAGASGFDGVSFEARWQPPID